MTTRKTRNDEFGLLEVACVTCGKVFIARPGYAYTRSIYASGRSKVKYFCKYSCMTAYDRAQEERAKDRRKKGKTPDVGASSVK